MNYSVPGIFVFLFTLLCLPASAQTDGSGKGKTACRAEFSTCKGTCPDSKANPSAFELCVAACRHAHGKCLSPGTRPAETYDQKLVRENPRGRCPVGYWISESGNPNGGFTCARFKTGDPSVGAAFVCPPGLVKQSDSPSMFDCLPQKQ
jgi:hypothetical protein